MRRPYLLRRALTTLLLATIASAAAAAIPGGDDPKAYTQHDLLKSRLDFNKRTLAGAYNAVGDRNPKWDDAAVKLLDAMALYFTYGPAEPIYKTVDLPTPEAYQALAKAVADAGCTDPLVSYCRAVLLLDEGQADAGLPLLRGCVMELAARKYPPYRMAAAAARAKRALPGGQQYAGPLWEASLAAADAPPVATDVRHLLNAIEFDDLAVPLKLRFCTALDARTTADPWIVNLLWGRYEVAAAWEARGSGWAGSVTDAGWKAFFEHLAKARDRFAKAHALHPEFPEPAADMVAVAMGAGEQLNTTTREWFDKAARAQLDYYPAYDKYVWSLWPRWGGSHVAMLQFGLECMRTERFTDTYVPFQLWKYVQQVNTDTGGDFAILKDPQVQVALYQLFTTMGQRAGGKESREMCTSILAALKWRAGDYRAAAVILDKLGDRVEPAAFGQVLAWGPEAISEVRAMNTPHADALTAARASAESGDHAAASAAYRAVEEKLGKDHPGYLFVHRRATVTRIQQEFAAGGWVTITPDESMAPWLPSSGEWTREADGAIVGVAPGPRGRAALVCRADFGTDYELRARLSVANPKVPSVPALFVRWINEDWYLSGGINALRRSIYARTAQGGVNPPPVVVKGGELISVRIEGLTMSVSVDGNPVLENQPAVMPWEGHKPYVALGIDSSGYGRTARFTDVQIRRLPEAAKP
jgi:hypothetical protein